jgi:hypothetical protein
MAAAISVVVCSHNPRHEYLNRVLCALRRQTLPLERWELILIDNASREPLSKTVDLRWHPEGRVVREEQLGLTPARLRGIKETSGHVLVFVDDDNVLDPDYLEVALRLSTGWPILGAWGGQVRPEFEIPPPDWTRPYWQLLAIREFTRDRWSNLVEQNETTPCGSGMCVRRDVAERYSTLVSADLRRLALDRKGNSLSSCGDTDLAFLACDMGLGTAQFTALRMTHLIPSERLEEEYLLRLVHDIASSGTVLRAIRGNRPITQGRSHRAFQKYVRWRLNPRSRRFYDARERGHAAALKEISTW